MRSAARAVQEVAGDVMDEFGHQLQEKNKPFAIPSLHRSILEKSPSERTATDIKLVRLHYKARTMLETISTASCPCSAT